jgi:hypothetical protein
LLAASPHNQLLRQIAHRSIRLVELPDKFLVTHLIQSWPRTTWSRLVTRHDAIDAPATLPGVDIEFGQRRLRNPPRVFDHVPIHIDNPNRSVGAGSNLHRTKPTVGRGEKLAIEFVGGSSACERDSGWIEYQAMHELMNRLAREGVPVIFVP